MTRANRPVKDTDEMVAGIRRQIKALEARAANEDPYVAADMASLADDLNAAVSRTVTRLRDVGYTWSDIGFDFKITATAARLRYGKPAK